ncbi:MAG: U32 family peptidase, partial [Bacteroidales bacterium]
EVFVHGSLCVSYSGRCYLSRALSGRSANRGECAQCCRLPYDLSDADGQILIQGKHLLSLKDMNRGTYIEQLLDAGVTSFKIEGRLKDAEYVKNTT